MIGSTSNKQVKRVVNLRASAKARGRRTATAEGLRACAGSCRRTRWRCSATEEPGSVLGTAAGWLDFP